MGLAEGAIRRDGQPAKKPGYAKGNPPPGSGRPAGTRCSLPGCCNLLPPPGPPGFRKTGPKSRYCSPEHGGLDYRQSHLHKRYGMTNDEYVDLLEEQGGVCAVCGSDDPLAPGRPRKDGEKKSQGSFHVDHDHETGKVRGLVCSMCNRMLGQGRDSSTVLQLGAEYLQRYGK